MTISAGTISQIPPHVLGPVNFVPRAILRRPVSYFVDRGYRFDAGTDDLDDYESAFFELDDGLRFALIRYRGEPRDCVTLYFEDDDGDKSEITGRILAALELPTTALMAEAHASSAAQASNVLSDK